MHNKYEITCFSKSSVHPDSQHSGLLPVYTITNGIKTVPFPGLSSWGKLDFYKDLPHALKDIFAHGNLLIKEESNHVHLTYYTKKTDSYEEGLEMTFKFINQMNKSRFLKDLQKVRGNA